MIMGAYVPAFTMRVGIPAINKWQSGFGLVPNAIIAPHYNEFPEVFSNLIFGSRPRETFLIGVDAETALVGSNGSWKAMGARRVTVKRDRATERYTGGQPVPFQ